MKQTAEKYERMIQDQILSKLEKIRNKHKNDKITFEEAIMLERLLLEDEKRAWEEEKNSTTSYLHSHLQSCT